MFITCWLSSPCWIASHRLRIVLRPVLRRNWSAFITCLCRGYDVTSHLWNGLTNASSTPFKIRLYAWRNGLCASLMTSRSIPKPALQITSRVTNENASTILMSRLFSASPRSLFKSMSELWLKWHMRLRRYERWNAGFIRNRRCRHWVSSRFVNRLVPIALWPNRVSKHSL